jgi:hypothetical protein
MAANFIDRSATVGLDLLFSLFALVQLPMVRRK